MSLKYLLVAGVSYLIGSFSSAYVLGKLLKKTDIRKFGSGNAGATNALRVFGKKIGILAFILDMFKGILAVYLGGKIMGYNGELIGGLFAVIGHNWPIFLKFKGGKGIATSFGVLLSLHWPIAIISFIFFLLVVIITRYVSLGSILSAFLVPILGVVINKPFNRNYFITTLILAILAIYRHRANIKRLIHGKEYKIGEKVE
ncbi:glycerol-3-phosphate 1-O-acyltransferase PlsY [Clostridium sp. Cult2]|uniref:glycerol-3-phosphate 1-O-acyltransferase PlsY n=1 Tax=Clostridium sp. Cult2 TaxID=2079003 RepID=UPI001F005288|nr:glycerol-3-phosphate 1-O-acyltransferase PlsY [Clostridium sp. Cult2]MCF6466455.1 acyl-phosphate glycerol 3-phosphate acyltransferase [Clostridium sp. Cult2]